MKDKKTHRTANFSNFDQSLKAVNLRLKSANIRVSIERKGGSLYARATLPPPPGSNKTSPYQQHLSLDIKANPSGLKRAEAEAKKIGAALDLKEFSWADYGRSQPKVEELKVKEWILLYESDYFVNGERTPTTKQTFKDKYLDYLKLLPQDQRLTQELLEEVIRSTIPNSCTRQKTCEAFKRFGKFVGLDVTFITSKLSGTYSSRRPLPRELPEEQEIVEKYYQIPNPAWQWIYGMLAAYGLRPHEVFHLDTRELEAGGIIVKVLESTKTGYREVYPLHLEWIDQFNLRQKQLPKVRVIGRANKALGCTVGGAFRRYKLGFPAYNLRHCYARRCIELGVHTSMAARAMGHSEYMHLTIYKRWLNASDDRKVFDRVYNDPNRPQPPKINPPNQNEDQAPQAA